MVHQFLFLSSFPGASNLHYKREAKGKKATAKEKIIMVNHDASLNIELINYKLIMKQDSTSHNLEETVEG